MSHPLLLIDAGNTRVKWAIATGSGALRLRGTISTGRVTAVTVRQLARKYPRHRAVLASVVPKVTMLFRSAFAGRLHVISGTSQPSAVPFAYPRPAELGADRIAAAAAIHAEKRGPAVIISCGTAVAFTLLDTRGRLMGGAIAPGSSAQLAALLGRAAQLPATSLRAPRRLPAKSTREAIRAGAWIGFQGSIKEITARLIATFPARPTPRILVTGGDAALLRGVLGPAAEMRPLLVLEGLRIIGALAFA